MRSVFLSPFVWNLRLDSELDTEEMNVAAQALVSKGEAKNFGAFRKKGSMASHTNIIIHSATVTTFGDLVVIDVIASWLVYGMMRLIANALIKVGLHKWSVEDFCEIVEHADRSKVQSSAPASGLCLIRVDYGSRDPFRNYALPAHPCFPIKCSNQFDYLDQHTAGL